jgi:CubicO group peptidase (beta-lactamase class C family)
VEPGGDVVRGTRAVVIVHGGHIIALLPEWRGDGRSAITLEQLLWMSSGLEFDEDCRAARAGDAGRLERGSVSLWRPHRIPPGNERWAERLAPTPTPGT